MQQEKLKLETELQQQLRKSIAQDYENQLRLLKQSEEEKEEKLKLARHKNATFRLHIHRREHKEAQRYAKGFAILSENFAVFAVHELLNRLGAVRNKA